MQSTQEAQNSAVLLLRLATSTREYSPSVQPDGYTRGADRTRATRGTRGTRGIRGTRGTWRTAHASHANCTGRAALGRGRGAQPLGAIAEALVVVPWRDQAPATALWHCRHRRAGARSSRY